MSIRMLLMALVVAAIGGAAACGSASVSTLDASAGAWQHEPAGFVPLTNQRWDAIAHSATGGRIAWLAARAKAMVMPPPGDSAWSYLRRSSSKDDDVVQETAAPFSPPNVLRIVFTPDMKRDHEPSVHFVTLPRLSEVYAAWWMKLSANWTCSPAGCGKVTFLFPDNDNGAGVTYSNLAGTNGSHYLNVATTWPSTGYRFWDPNVTKTPISDGRWYRVEWYAKWSSGPDAADGVIRWWVNGVLNGDHREVPFPAIKGFIEFQHAPTRQDPPAAEQYMFIDHTYLSAPAAQVK